MGSWSRGEKLVGLVFLSTASLWLLRPVINGALDTARAGILSSLQSENERLDVQVEAAEWVRNNGRWALLFDPQTSGGLLATVPDSESSACRDALREAGYEYAEIIGTVKAMTGHDSRVHVV